MDDHSYSSDVLSLERGVAPCLTGLPVELLLRIIGLALAVGQERDVSALARTSKSMHEIVNSELYRLVIRYRTSYIVHWAAKENRMGTLKTAFKHGADPNQMRTSINPTLSHRRFRPVGWNLDNGTDFKLDLAVWRQGQNLRRLNSPGTALVWREVLFSSASLSTTSKAQLRLLLSHYRQVLHQHNPNNAGQFRDNDDARVVDLSTPPDENFAFPEGMSPADMDRRDVKIGFVRLFQYWDTPLHIAAYGDRVSIAKALLVNAADVDRTAVGLCRCRPHDMPTSAKRTVQGNHLVAHTPLHVAICGGSFRVAKLLVAHGAERLAMMFTGNDDREWLSENALHRALSNRDGYYFNYNFIEFLLDHGYAARIEERNHEDLTPLLIVINLIGDPGVDDVVKLLLRYGADPNNPGPCSPASRFHIRAVLLGGGGGEWAPPVVWAAREAQFELAKLLLDHGADARATSSLLRENALYAACTATDPREDLIGWPFMRQRMELLDTLLASDITNDLNTFDQNDRTPLMDLIIFRIFDDPAGQTGKWETRLFAAGADIMAGANTGKVTPFEAMIDEVLERLAFHPRPLAIAEDVSLAIWDILQASGITQHRYRPTAILNQLWGHVERVYTDLDGGWGGPPNIEIVPYMLIAFIKAGFSPAEVDRHGDTAMTSFLQRLLWAPELAWRDSQAIFSEGWLLPMIMALLQEHDAALNKWNDEGYTACDYLERIVEYDGEDAELNMLRHVMRRSVEPDLDAHGDVCLKFHPMRVFSSLGRNNSSGDNTVQRLMRNPSRWLVCEHLCNRGYCSNLDEDWQCGCARDDFKTYAECHGDCCQPSS